MMSIDLKENHLLKPGLLGKWVAERADIWQMHFLSDDELERLAGKLGLSFSSHGNDVKRLWQLGLIRADLVVSSQPLNIPDLLLVGEDEDGNYCYADERLSVENEKGFVDTIGSLPEFPSYIDLQFHPFRYYVLYQIDKALRLRINPLQMLRSKDDYHKLLQFVISGFQRRSSSTDFKVVVARWNLITSLAVAAEPHTYQRIFGTIRYSGSSTREQHQRLVQQHWSEFKESLIEIGIERVEKARSDLCFDATLLDPNVDVLFMLRLSRGESRLKSVEGRLGGALYLMTMAEMLRRATEKALEIELLEEDELTHRWDVGIKEHRYGVKRILDGSRNVKNEFVRKFGLDYGIRLRWYVEGSTEYGALYSFFGSYGPIDVVNLRGNVVAKKGKGVGFRDDLRRDVRTNIFSFVSVDGDRGDYLRAVHRAAEADEICGMFFVSDPDFEFANFTVQELTEVVWETALDNGASPKEKAKLFQATAETTSKKTFVAAAKRACSALSQFSTNDLWGRKLMTFAWKNQSMLHPDKTTKRRRIVEAVRAAIDTVNAGYYFMRTEYKVDPATGVLVPRSPSKGILGT